MSSRNTLIETKDDDRTLDTSVYGTQPNLTERVLQHQCRLLEWRRGVSKTLVLKLVSFHTCYFAEYLQPVLGLLRGDGGAIKVTGVSGVIIPIYTCSHNSE